MKDLFSAFGSAVFSPLVSLVLPGLAAISAWFFVLVTSTGLGLLASRNHTETAFLLMLLSIFVGTIIDDLGMRIESLWLDRKRNARTSGLHAQEWWRYLCKPFNVEPSGRRHLRRLVARLKFELGVPIGLAMTVPAIWLNPMINDEWAAIATAVAFCLSAYLLIEASATHDALGQLRHELLEGSAVECSVVHRRTMQSA
jgi:hypothetical protein